MVGSLAASTLILTGIPANGDQTLRLILVEPLTNGIAVAKPVVPPTVVPAQSSAPAVLMDLATLLSGFVGSTTISEALPPKSVRP